MSPSDRKYSQEHEWIMLEDAETGRALAGITDYAQDQLGDIVFFELPKLGSAVTATGKSVTARGRGALSGRSPVGIS